MENINLKILQEALIERYKANSIVESLQSKIASQVERLAYKKYKEASIFRDEMDFELIGVRCSLDHCSDWFELQNIGVTLYYLCKSKLPKAQREKVEQYKKSFLEKGYFNDYSRPKKPLCFYLRYSISPENALSGNFNLNLEE
jgi:hypothetical protein